jgi:hypothetical protein
MVKRVTTEEIADAVINANEILGLEPRSSSAPTDLDSRRPKAVSRKSVA